ncbi:MAG TPA: PEP-CTERM sorting domain-containing protein [Methylomirabilota bacterium]|nr:PEP-CTERM sorting domain-containing protein [Methylomirabilota bacterium]
MKKLLVAVAAVLVSASAFAQGQLNFNNRLTGVVDAPISRPDGTGAGAGVTAELVLVQGGSETVLTPVTTFRTSSAAATFYVNPVDVIVPGVQAGQTATLKVRAYEGASYATATLRGESATFNLALGGTPPGGAPLTPPALAGLQGFALQVVPEPSTIALGVLGAAALLLRRRK